MDWDTRLKMFDDTPEVISWLDTDTYEGAETADHVIALYSDLRAAVDEIRHLRRKLISEREDNLWSAYQTGYETEDRWSHHFMSTGEWLVDQCGLDPGMGNYDASAIKAAIPKAARKVLESI